MLDRRFTLMLAAALAGLALGVVAWAAAGGPKMAEKRIAAAEAAQPRVGKPGRVVTLADGDWVGAPVLFDAVLPSEPQVRLLGLSRSARRTAALVAIGDGAATWMTPGETREGVTLEAVAAASITVETATGEHDVRLGEPTGGTAGVTPAETPGVAVPPSIGRGPPPPASAPAMSGG